MKRVLFVCTGNTCRSSMAEAVFNSQVVSDKDLTGKMTASSAGIAAFDGDPASLNSINVLKEKWGIDLTCHRARLLDLLMIKSSDLILTMTREHKRAVVSMYPQALDKIFTLKEFSHPYDAISDNESGSTLDVTDPYGMPVQGYKSCAEDIAALVVRVIERLKNETFFDI